MTTSGDDPDRPSATTAELEQGLRFVHALCTQNKHALERVEAMLAALTRELEQRGAVEAAAVRARLAEAHEEVAALHRQQLRVQVGTAADKHQVPSADVDCASLLPVCQARCCRLTVHLSFQDLDDGLRWDYARPYEIAHDERNYCVHNVGHGCGVYAKRPAPCRSYDCRNDPRIWIDFSARVPAPMSATDRDPDLVQLRRPRL